MKKYIKKLLVALETVCNNNPVSIDELILILNELNLNDVRDIHHNLNNDIFYLLIKNVGDRDLIKLIIEDIGIDKLKITKLSNFLKVKDEQTSRNGSYLVNKCGMVLVDSPYSRKITSTTIYNEFSDTLIMDEWK